LLEAAVAIGILTVGMVSLAGLASIAVRNTVLARDRSMAAVLAVQKMEQLCVAAMTLPLSSSDAIAADQSGFVEYLDRTGTVLEGGRGAPGVVHVRRWAVWPLSADGNLLAIEVAVGPCRRAQPPAGACGDSGSSVRLASVRSRVAW